MNTLYVSKSLPCTMVHATLTHKHTLMRRVYVQCDVGISASIISVMIYAILSSKEEEKSDH